MTEYEQALKQVGNVVATLLGNEARAATKYISPKMTVTASRVLFGGKIDKREKIQIALTIGKPNFAAREFIKLCKEAKEPFPVRNIQLKYPPKGKSK